MNEIITGLNTEKRKAGARYDRLVLYSRKLYLQNGKTEKYATFIDELYENFSQYVTMIEEVKTIIENEEVICF